MGVFNWEPAGKGDVARSGNIWLFLRPDAEFDSGNMKELRAIGFEKVEGSDGLFVRDATNIDADLGKLSVAVLEKCEYVEIEALEVNHYVAYLAASEVAE